jgi:ankyrin repeat protein
MTPLNRAASSGTLAAIRILCEHGARLNNTALHNAIRRCRDDPDKIVIVECLLDHGLDVNATEVDVEMIRSSSVYTRLCYSPTPLHLAIDDDNVEMVRLLLSRGADPGKKSRTGKWPIGSAFNLFRGIEFSCHRRGLRNKAAIKKLLLRGAVETDQFEIKEKTEEETALAFTEFEDEIAGKGY